MDSLQDILGKKDFKAPDEVKQLKDYVWRHYRSGCTVRQSHGALVLSVRSSALAGTLQMEKPKIIRDCSLKQSLVIRTG